MSSCCCSLGAPCARPPWTGCPGRGRRFTPSLPSGQLLVGAWLRHKPWCKRKGSCLFHISSSAHLGALLQPLQGHLNPCQPPLPLGHLQSHRAPAPAAPKARRAWMFSSFRVMTTAIVTVITVSSSRKAHEQGGGGEHPARRGKAGRASFTPLVSSSLGKPTLAVEYLFKGCGRKISFTFEKHGHKCLLDKGL